MIFVSMLLIQSLFMFLFQNNNTALIVAASKGKLYFVRELINHGADANAEDAVSHYKVFACDVKVIYTR